MSHSHPVSYFVRSVSRVAVWAAVLAAGVTSARAELLIEHERGGLDRWTSIGGPVAGGFHLFEPTRIEGVTAWMNAIGPVGVAITDNLDYINYSEEFTGSSPFGVPGKWQGVSGLKWDLQPGDYYVVFSDGGFPIGYGGPPSTAPQGFQSFDADYGHGQWESIGFPLGMRVYGNLLSAVPEPSSYGTMAAVALLGLIVVRRRRSALNSTAAA
jgi:hypothetical protein